MKLKLIALAAMLAAGSANAAIDSGAGGNGELFFNIWDANGSYTLDLNQSIDAFNTGVANAGFINLSWAADSTLTNFLAGANTASLKWNIMATDSKGSPRLLTTYSLPEASVTKNADVIRTASSSVGGFVNNVNVELGGANSVAVTSASAAWAGKPSFGDNVGGLLNFSNAGTLSNNSYDSGLGFMRIDAGGFGIAASQYNEYLDSSVAVNAWVDADNGLHLAAAPVPEASTYGMMLAGLGLVGFMARRRLSA